jgi:Tn3 transposase DDE domain
MICDSMVADLNKKSADVDEYLLAHLSPLGWEHINLTGDYVAFQQTGGQGPISTLAKLQRFDDASVYAANGSLACFIFRYSEFRNIPSCRSASALGADEFRSVELLGSEYSALPI